LRKLKNYVLSSVFSTGDLKFIKNISHNKKDDSYFILDSGNWIKGRNKCIEYAKKNKLKYELVGRLSYPELLINMSTKKGIIYMPQDNDTCPRLVIESYLLGCEQHLNEYVQHVSEPWAKKSPEEYYKYLKRRPKSFWKKVLSES